MAGSHDRSRERSAAGSRSASQRPRGRSPGARRNDGRQIIVQERVVSGVGGGTIVYPELTSTNYVEWAQVMKVNLRAQRLWSAIDVDDDDEVPEDTDMGALAALIRAVPPEMKGIIASKDTAKEGWDAIKMMRLGVERVREAAAERLRRQLERFAFNDGESLDSFGMRLSNHVNHMATLGEPVATVMVN